MVKVAVLGYGTVGSGIVEVIKTNLSDDRPSELPFHHRLP